MKTLIIATVALAAFAFVGTNAVEAGHGHSGISVQFGSGAPHFHGFYGQRRQFRNFGLYGVRSGWSNSWYHQSGHWDYHPGGVVRHRNHFDYIPGHYDWHDTSHWHH
jgi:hypothetical protein